MPSIQAEPRKANLFIVGAPKCGTTAWMEYLGAHPDIFFPDTKEECFFALDLPNFRFIESEEDYSKLFAQSGKAKVIGEASAMYLFSEVAAQAIRTYNPDAKILVFLREQEEYLPALHNQYLWEFTENIQDFATAWTLSGRRSSGNLPRRLLEPRTLDYRAMGRFHEQVSRYLEAFGDDQVHVNWFDDWIADPRRTYLDILRFLGVEDDGRVEFPVVNPGVTYRSTRLVHFLYYPPQFIRGLARFLRRATGMKRRTMSKAALGAVQVLSRAGYKRIPTELKHEIREYYANDNRRLRQRLRRYPGAELPESGRNARAPIRR